MYYDRSRHIQSPPAAYRPKKRALCAVYGLQSFKVSLNWILKKKKTLSIKKKIIVKKKTFRVAFSSVYRFPKNNIFEHKTTHNSLNNVSDKS